MLKTLSIISLCLLLVGCQSNGKQEQTQTSSPKKIGDGPEAGGLFSSIFSKSTPKSIALPPDLVGKANGKVRENHERAEESLRNQKVLPPIAGTQLMSNNDGRRWLKIEADAQTVWDTLAEFWAAEQIDLVEYQPAAGLMETDWIASDRPKDGEKPSVVASLFNRVIGKGTSFDKYKIRLERNGDDVTNIFVTHRSTAKRESNFTSGIKITEWEWVEGESDQEKVSQLLQVIVLLFESKAQQSV